MGLSKRLRYEILRRDKHTCRYCGESAPVVTLTVDHVVPVALGGDDEPTNLVAACVDCNSGKTSSSPDAPLVADVAEDALRWSNALQLAARRALDDYIDVENYRDLFDDAWTNWSYGPSSNRQHLPRPEGWKRTVDRFMAAGLPGPLLEECVYIAMTVDKVPPDSKFNYMCGIAWKKITAIQESARDEITEQATAESESDGVETVIPRAIWSHVRYAHFVQADLRSVIDGGKWPDVSEVVA